MQGDRYNKGKLKWSYVDFESLEDLVRVLEQGANKYAVDNWKKGLYTTEVTESLLRHTFSFLQGEDIDTESGCSHIGHIMANAMFLKYMTKHRPEFDNRPKVDKDEVNEDDNGNNIYKWQQTTT